MHGHCLVTAAIIRQVIPVSPLEVQAESSTNYGFEEGFKIDNNSILGFV
jgi:hypothetical protein